MFSKKLMSIFAAFGKILNIKKEEEETVKEIRFKDNYFGKLAYATVCVRK